MPRRWLAWRNASRHRLSLPPMPDQPTDIPTPDEDRRSLVAEFVQSGYLLLQESPTAGLLADLVDALDDGPLPETSD